MTIEGLSCVTCGDRAAPLTVVSTEDDLAGFVRCRADDGGMEMVAADLVGPVAVGDRLLVHAAVAIARLEPV